MDRPGDLLLEAIGASVPELCEVERSAKDGRCVDGANLLFDADGCGKAVVASRCDDVAAGARHRVVARQTRVGEELAPESDPRIGDVLRRRHRGECVQAELDALRAIGRRCVVVITQGRQPQWATRGDE